QPQPPCPVQTQTFSATPSTALKPRMFSCRSLHRWRQRIAPIQKLNPAPQQLEPSPSKATRSPDTQQSVARRPPTKASTQLGIESLQRATSHEPRLPG